MTKLAYAFGPFLFAPRRQLLLRDGEAIRIGCRALDLLAAFVQRPGEVLAKSELMNEAWPNTTVVEGNLKVHIASLRRALDDDADQAQYIATVNGRGYRFVAPVSTMDAPTAFSDATLPQRHPPEVPSARIGPLEARYREVVTLLAQTMRSAVVDLPVDGEPDACARLPRRVLCIELGERDEAWIEDLFVQRRHQIPATR